jgi:hypothetical protein
MPQVHRAFLPVTCCLVVPQSLFSHCFRCWFIWHCHCRLLEYRQFQQDWLNSVDSGLVARDKLPCGIASVRDSALGKLELVELSVRIAACR